MSVWSPDQYNLFREQRRQPFLDLLSGVEKRPGMRVIDLGCGTGALTRHLHDHLDAAETLGVDNADTMLAKSVAHVTAGLRFKQVDLAAYGEGARFDLVFSNAALHWVPDHPSLLERIAGMLRPGAQLAIQIPYNFNQPSHIAANLTASEPPFREALNGYIKPVHVLPPEQYARLLHRLGFAKRRVHMQVYEHLLPSRKAVVEWVKGTTLTDYQRRMSADLFDAFVERYESRLEELAPDESPHLFTFNRILFWASR